MLYKICLHCITGKEKGKKWKLSIADNTIVIGRLKGCHLVLSDDQISQSHCLLQIQEEELCIIDMGSSKGTYVNDKKIDGKHILKNNETIQLGTTFLKIEILSPDSTKIHRSQISTHKLEQEQYVQTISKKEEAEKVFIRNSVKQSQETIQDDDLLVKEFLAHNHVKEQSNSEIENLENKEKLDSDSTNINIQKCILCEQSNDGLDFVDEQSKWLCCSLCKKLGRFLQEWDNYQVIGKPLWIDSNGLFVITIDRHNQNKEYAYIYRQGSCLEEVSIDIPDVMFMPLRREKIKEYSCTFYRFMHGNFWDIHSFLTPMQVIKLAVDVAEKISLYSTYKMLKQIVPHYLFITATNKPMLFDVSSSLNIHDSNFDKISCFQAPEVLCGQNDIDNQANIFSFAAIIFSSMYKQKVYESNNMNMLKKEAKEFCWENISIKTNPHPIAGKFFAKTLCSKHDRYKQWSDVVSSLHMLMLIS